jgi:DNA-binding SARP family transcriptional activator
VADMRFQVLGPLRVRRGGAPVPIQAGKQRVVLATLLLRANRVVSVDELVERLWDRDIPVDAKGTVQKYVMRLRRVLDGDRIRTEPAGYRIRVADGELDLDRFTQLTRESDDAALAEALAMWQGTPLSNVDSEWLRRQEVPALVEQYLLVVERRIDADLRHGRYAEVAAELAALVRKHPLRERFWAQRMRALHGAGRQGEALTAYREVATLLADELGVTPGEELRTLHLEILRETDVDLTPLLRQVRPKQLPMELIGFVGRQAELAAITEALDGPVPIVMITGPGGAGKTATAVRAAHRLADRFPDGQLFADLRAYSDAAPLHPTEVLGRFLRALGVPDEQMPLDLDDQVATYRSLLADRRVLVVLDNVRDAAQVRPLLPGAAGCAVLVTSRDELSSLGVWPGGRRVPIQTLTAAEARELLSDVLGDRAHAEPAAVDELAELCGRHALALRVAAANLQLRPGQPIAGYVKHLRARGPIVALRLDDGPAGDQRDLAATFDSSYRLLAPEQQRMLRLLGEVSCPEITPPAAAALAGTTVPDAADQLERLAAASLLDRGTADGYGLHDLVRAYAVWRDRDEEDDAARTAARCRLVEHYTGLVDVAMRPHVSMHRLSRPPIPATVPPDTTPEDVDAQRPAMVAVLRDAARLGPFTEACVLADAMRPYFTLRGHAVDWLTVVEAGLHAAQQADYDEATAALLNGRGALAFYTGDLPEASQYFRAALEIYERLGSPVANGVRANVAETSGTLTDTIALDQAALDGYVRDGATEMVPTAAGNLVVDLVAYGDLGRAHAEWNRWLADVDEVATVVVGAMLTEQLGDLRAAVDRYDTAMAQVVALRDTRTELDVLNYRGACLVELGRFADARRDAREWLARGQPDRGLPFTLAVLGDASWRLGEVDQARIRYEKVLSLTTDVSPECAALIGYAELLLSVGDVGSAAARAREAVALAEKASRRLWLCRALVLLAECQRRTSELPAAHATLTRGRELAQECDYPLGLALARAEAAQLHLADGDVAAARADWKTALADFERIGSYRAEEVRARLR